MSKKTKKLLTTLLSLLLVIVFVLLFFKFITPSKEEPNNNQLELDENAGEYVEPEKVVDHSRSIVLPGWGSFTIPKETTDITAGIDLYNPSSNHWYKCPECGSQLDDDYKCMNEKCGKQSSKDKADEDCYYMTFALYLANNDEKLYESKLVEPSLHIQHIQISRPLEEGEYDAYVFIQPYKSDRATACNNGKVSIKLYVK